MPFHVCLHDWIHVGLFFLNLILALPEQFAAWPLHVLSFWHVLSFEPISSYPCLHVKRCTHLYKTPLPTTEPCAGDFKTGHLIAAKKEGLAFSIAGQMRMSERQT